MVHSPSFVQFHLPGMIGLLSRHLYSQPGVFIREALQNAADAIAARARLDAPFAGRIVVEAHPPRTLAIQDNGVGMTERQLRAVLSGLGEALGRREGGAAALGQFGIGLLAGFAVCDEIVLVTRSALDVQGLEWRGRSNGAYTLRRLQREVPVGTTLFLACSPGNEAYSDYNRVHDWLEHYGIMLPVPILLSNGQSEEQINDTPPPWRLEKAEALAYGEMYLHQRCLDIIPLRSHVGDIEGVAYILPHPPRTQSKNKHRTYLKRMLLSDTDDSLVPPWANSFVTCMLNTNLLSPTASREALLQTELLESARAEVGSCIKRYLANLASTDLALLRRLLNVHSSAFKALVAEAHELYALFMPYLSFETALGEKTGRELATAGTVYVAGTAEDYRLCRRVARSLGLLVVNGGQAFAAELVRRLSALEPGMTVITLQPQAMSALFSLLMPEEAEQARPFQELADMQLARYRCQTAFRWFEMEEVAVVYLSREEAALLRIASPMNDGAPGNDPGEPERLPGKAVSAQALSFMPETALLCFNYRHPVVREALTSADRKLQRLTTGLLYAQGKQLACGSLKPEEQRLLHSSLLQLMKRGASSKDDAAS